MQAKRAGQDLGHMSSLGSMGGKLGVPRLRPDWSIQTQTSKVLVSFTRILCNGHPMGRCWEAGKSA